MSVTAESVRAFLARVQQLQPTELDDDTPLFSSGLVDSFALVDLIDHVETEGGFRMRHEELVLDNFDTVARIVAYAERRAAEGGAA